MTASLADPAREFAVEVVRKLRAAGYDALWAGGCVRDQLLGRVPKDYDVATSATPHEIRELFGRHRTLAIGAAFGVITVLGRKAEGQIEVATFRQDLGYSDGRHPDRVTFTTAREDAKRRDFTINALFYDPIDDRTIDYVGGEEDLQRRIVRAVGDASQRFAEDKLRMLRAVRFAATFDFTIEPATLAAIQAHAAEIRSVSAERIADEMRRMLVHPQRARAIQLLQTSQLLPVLLPEAERLAPEPDRRGKPTSVWKQTLQVLAVLEQPSFSVALAALLRDMSTAGSAPEAVAVAVGRRWKLANKEVAVMCHLLQGISTIRSAEQQPWPRLQRLLTADHVEELLQLSEAVARVVDGDTRHVDFCRHKLRLPPGELNPPPLVTGNDLQAMGMKPSPVFKAVLESLRDAQLEKRIETRQEAMELARQLEAEGRSLEARGGRRETRGDNSG